MFRIAFLEPQIAPNTGNAIRMVAGTGCELHLIGPLGFDLSDAKLRRAGLDYHDLASVTVHRGPRQRLGGTAAGAGFRLHRPGETALHRGRLPAR